MEKIKGKIIENRGMVYLDDVLDMLDEVIIKAREAKRTLLYDCYYEEEDFDDDVYIINPERKDEIMAFIEEMEKTR